jgi:glycosyltransferase involved in cell wall biosynthesis
VSFIKPCYSKQASSPTKNAEYLAMGLPIVANAGTGDTDTLIKNEGVGVIVDDLDPEAFREAFRSVRGLILSDPELPERCKKAAKKHFDLSEVGGMRYQRIYRRLLETK